MISATAIVLSIPYLADLIYPGWSTLHWDYPKLLIIAVIIEAAFPLSQSLIKIMQLIMPSSTGKTKQQEIQNQV
jgi:hypothetical protein